MDFHEWEEAEEPSIPVGDGEVLFGFDIEALPEGFTATAIVSLIGTLDEDGDPALSLRSSTNVSPWEMLGMLRSAVLTTEQDVLAMWDFGAERYGPES